VSLTPWGTTVTVEVSSAAPDSDTPVWVDISDYVTFRSGSVDMQSGRQTPLDADEPARLELGLRNDDHRFTSGNPSSPYYPWWKSQRRIRVRELFATSLVDLFDGYIELPTTAAETDPVDGVGTELTLTLTAVDKLGRLQVARRFISTLGEHILANGGTALQAYYPMNQAALPMTEVAGRYPSLDYDFDAISAGFQRGNPIPAQPAFGSLAADDAAVLRTSYNWDGTTLTGFRPLHANLRSAPITVAVGQTVTVVTWINLDVFDLLANPTPASSLSPLRISWDEGGGGSGSMQFEPDGFLVGGSKFVQWAALLGSTSFSASTFTVEGPAVATGVAYPVALRLTAASSLEWWIGPNRTVDTTITGSAVSLSIRDLWAPMRAFQGLIGHTQIYVGAAGDWDFGDYLLQYSAGLSALERQTTGQRINAILDYAGVSATARDIDPGVAVMGPASLAGKTPGDALEEARRTDGGRLFASADGRIKFHDRVRVYNI
jgi:hypothetical protein